MNWLGWSTHAFVGALLGALLGAFSYNYMLAHSLDVPWMVGLGTGLGAFVGAPDRSGMRGLLVSTVAVWSAWAVQVRVPPYSDAGLFGFHRTLTPSRLGSFVACAAIAFLFARSSIHPDARRRIPGS